MCIAIYQAPGAKLPADAILNGWVNNPDGGGFAYIGEDNQICTFHSLDFDTFYEVYEQAWCEHGQRSPFIVHMRWATTGSVAEYNCHPYLVGDSPDTVLIHNGIIDIDVPKKGDWSDTRWFAKRYLGSLHETWLDDWAMREMVGDFIGSSKLVLMTVDPKLQHNVYIINEEKGFWADEKKRDIWYSNSSCQPTTIRKWNGKTSSWPLTSVAKTAAKGDTGRAEGVSWDGYLDARYLGSDDRPQMEDDYEFPCPLCNEVDCVDEATGICRECEWCVWCDNDLGVCACFEEEETAEEETDGSQLSIYDMTDEQVAQLR